jgi:HrpA-like RNA helicase
MFHLPIHDHEVEFLELIVKNQVVIVVGETGSGKTTHLPLFLLKAGFCLGGQVCVTEPRRLLTTEVAGFVAFKRNVACGEEVGYRIRHDNNTSPCTEIVFMTLGMLLREMLGDPDLLKYKVIMVDEAHETSTNLVILLGMLKALLLRRPDLKVVISSATIDSAKYADHFDGAPVLEVQGREHKVEISYEPVKFGKQYTHKIAALVRRIHHDKRARKDGPNGNILAFLTGEKDILATAKLIEEMNLGVVVCPLFAQLSKAEQDFAARPRQKRTVILATNIAEAGLTFPKIKYVIDSGLIKQNYFDPETGFTVLEVVKHAQSGCDQRSGRTGREEEDGFCIRLYQENDYNKRLKYSTSEITRESVASIILYLKGMGIHHIDKFPLLESPDPEHIEAATEHLIALGALSAGKQITADGKKMLSFPVEPHQARQILAAIRLGCTEAVLTIVAMISASFTPFVEPIADDELEEAQALIARKNFEVPVSDHLTYLNVYNRWLEAGGSLLPEKWYEDNWLNPTVLYKAEKILEQLKGIIGKTYKKGSSDRVLIRQALTEGLLHNVCKKNNNGRFVHLLTGKAVGLNHHSSLADNIQLITAEEMVTNQRVNGKIRACICSEVNFEWLPESIQSALKSKKNKKNKK